ncbi:hypothetical protein HMPREF9441_01815 [Paraprevotella clara YIT 11840]|uniref:Uncharacterized protein n=1 Tax=Paraprevotella clara YIT 11840 TaxID=762968 RepID=G5SR25_9BACT|nr:hypothetical protein HMPREF9441_01815 [Paraprevotella clara YIT 11840]
MKGLSRKLLGGTFTVPKSPQIRTLQVIFTQSTPTNIDLMRYTIFSITKPGMPF